MELAVAPPPRVAAGVCLRNPLVVIFLGSSAKKDSNAENGQAFKLPSLSGMWAFLSLTTADMDKSLAPPREDLFQGRRIDSIHPVVYKQESDCPAVAYATFPALTITQPGSYRIKVSIIDMNTYCHSILVWVNIMLMKSRSFGGNRLEEGGKVLPCLHSQVFEVVEASDHSGCGRSNCPCNKPVSNSCQRRNLPRRLRIFDRSELIVEQLSFI